MINKRDPKPSTSARRRLARIVLYCAIGLAGGALLRPLLEGLGAAGLPHAKTIAFAGLLTVVALMSASYPANLLLRLRTRGSSRRIGFRLAFFARIHEWQPITLQEADEVWTMMHRLPRHSTLVAGWRCRDCEILRLECRAAEGGRRYALYGGGLSKKPWLVWLAGISVRAASESLADSRTRWSLRTFERLECEWVPLSDSQLRDEVLRLEDVKDSGPILGWRCPNNTGVRLNLLDVDGDDFLVFAELPEEPEPKWYAGVFFIFGKATQLASDTIDTPWSPTPVSSSPPPRTPPS